MKLYLSLNGVKCSSKFFFLTYSKFFCIEDETTERIFFSNSTIRTNPTEENSRTVEFNTTSSTTGLADEVFIASTQFVSTSNRQIHPIDSYCEELPQIEYAQLLSDETIKHSLNDQIVYSGSLVFTCQFGFISNDSLNESFRLTCQNGIFHPTIICIGN